MSPSAPATPVSPARRRGGSLLGTVVFTPLWALPFALFFGTIFGGRWEQYRMAFAVALVYTLVIRLAIWATGRWLVPALRIPEKDASWLPLAALYMGVSLAGSLIAAEIVNVFLLHDFMRDVRGLVVVFLYALLFAGLFMGIVFARHFYRAAVERGAQVERIRGELARAELRTLRAQVHPHFLFNTLNSIAALIAENPHGAEDLVTRLADVFRYSLAASRHDHARFAEELDFLRNWLQIEHARFGDRLRVEESIAPGLDDLLVPTLLFQPLLENAVRYGVSSRPEGGTVRLEAVRDGELLRVTIADDGPGFEPGRPPQGHGVGLESVRERLRLEGDPHALAIDSGPGRGTRVTVTLPARTAAAVTSPLPDPEVS